MACRVELTERAARELTHLYRTINAENATHAHARFNGLERVILSLDENPARGLAIPENDDFRHLLYGRGRNAYRITYAIDEHSQVVTVLHIRHGAREAFGLSEQE
jgi:toxin ParE1/3/4